MFIQLISSLLIAGDFYCFCNGTISIQCLLPGRNAGVYNIFKTHHREKRKAVPKGGMLHNGLGLAAVPVFIFVSLAAKAD